MNGDTALRALRTMGFATVPVAAVTANSTPEDIERYLEQGFAASLSKPFSPEQMHALLCSVLHL